MVRGIWYRYVCVGGAILELVCAHGLFLPADGKPLKVVNMSPKKISLCVLLVFLGLEASSCSRDAASYVSRGNSFFTGANYGDAALNYRKALQKDSQSGEAYYRLGLADLKLGNPREAYNMLMRAAELLPDRDDIRVELG